MLVVWLSEVEVLLVSGYLGLVGKILLTADAYARLMVY